VPVPVHGRPRTERLFGELMEFSVFGPGGSSPASDRKIGKYKPPPTQQPGGGCVEGGGGGRRALALGFFKVDTDAGIIRVGELN
jgi:hypothetical protein